MKLITRDTDYAVRALCFIAKREEETVPVSTLVRELKIPRPFLRQILQMLNKKGIVKSHKGSNGGFQLAISPERIYLVELIRIFKGSLKLSECLFKKKICPNRSKCALKKKIDAIEKKVVSELGAITIASLLVSVQHAKQTESIDLSTK